MQVFVLGRRVHPYIDRALELALQVGPQLSKPTIGKPHPAHRAMAEKTGGRRDGCSTDSKKIGVGWDSCGWRVP